MYRYRKLAYISRRLYTFLQPPLLLSPLLLLQGIHVYFYSRVWGLSIPLPGGGWVVSGCGCAGPGDGCRSPPAHRPACLRRALHPPLAAGTCHHRELAYRTRGLAKTFPTHSGKAAGCTRVRVIPECGIWGVSLFWPGSFSPAIEGDTSCLAPRRDSSRSVSGVKFR